MTRMKKRIAIKKHKNRDLIVGGSVTWASAHKSDYVGGQPRYHKRIDKNGQVYYIRILYGRPYEDDEVMPLAEVAFLKLKGELI